MGWDVKKAKTYGKWAVGLFFLLALVTFYVSPRNIFAQVVYLIAPLSTLLAGILITKKYYPGGFKGVVYLYFTIGLGLWFLGEFSEFVFALDTFSHIDPFPSVADVFYLLGYPFLFMGAFVLLRQGEGYWNSFKRGSYAFGLLLAVALFAYFGIYLAYDASVPMIENVITMLYNIGDFILVICALSLIFVAHSSPDLSEHALSRCWYTFVAGFFFTLVADILYSYFQLQYEQELMPFVQLDLIWIAAYLLFTYAFFCMFLRVRSVEEDVGTKISSWKRSKKVISHS